MIVLALQLLIFDPVAPQPTIRLVGDLSLQAPALAESVSPQPPAVPPLPEPPPQKVVRPPGWEIGAVLAGVLVYAPAAVGSGLLVIYNLGFCADTCTRQASSELFALGAALYLVGTPLLTTLVVYAASPDATGGVAKAFFPAALVNLAALAGTVGLWSAHAPFPLAVVVFTVAGGFATSWVAAQFLDYGPPPAPKEPLPASQARPEGPAPRGLPAPVAVVPLLSGTW